jgi:hypothetical protein
MLLILKFFVNLKIYLHYIKLWVINNTKKILLILKNLLNFICIINNFTDVREF